MAVGFVCTVGWCFYTWHAIYLVGAAPCSGAWCVYIRVCFRVAAVAQLMIIIVVRQ